MDELYCNKSLFVAPVTLTSCNSPNSYPFIIEAKIIPTVALCLTTIPTLTSCNGAIGLTFV